MGLFELHVERIDVTTVPKFVLFGKGERNEKAVESVATGEESDRKIKPPVSVGKVIAVSVAATVLAFAAVRLKALVDRKLDRLR